MGLPSFLLRKIYRRGSLHETGEGRFAFILQNPLADVTIVAPPQIVVNGVLHPPEAIVADGLDLASIGPENPFLFHKGAEADLEFRGRLLRGANRIHVVVLTKEFGELGILIEDREPGYCDLPGEEE